MTAVCLQRSLTAVRPCDNRSGVGGGGKEPLLFVYLRCIPTVVQAVERETDRKEDGGESEGGAAALKKMMRRLFLEAAD